MYNWYNWDRRDFSLRCLRAFGLPSGQVSLPASTLYHQRAAGGADHAGVGAEIAEDDLDAFQGGLEGALLDLVADGEQEGGIRLFPRDIA